MKTDVDKLKDIASDTLHQHGVERLRKKLTERAQEIKDAPPSQQMDFFCIQCNKDFGAIGFKQVRLPKDSVWFAWYETNCPEGHKTLRYITDKIEDPYFVLSPFIKAQQNEFEDATLPPWHPRFRALYPLQYNRLKEMALEGELSKLENNHDSTNR